jgi:AcrR family transcriptional regulator
MARVGHREDLLAGAKRCLVEKGYARTTARDIVAASGTNLASIGYHYGSKEALLNMALIDAINDTSEELARALATDLDPEAAPLERFEAIWSQVVSQFTSHRQLWLASFEVFAQVDRAPLVREALAAGIQQGREGLGLLFQAMATDAAKEADDATLRAVGSFYQALLTGVMAQWLVDPDNSPTGADLATALRTIASWVGLASEADETDEPAGG